MTCFNSLYAWRSEPSSPDKKSRLIFNPAQALERGIFLSEENAMHLPCGRCIGCMKDRSRAWSIRLYHEMQFHEQCSFVTLTYEDDSQVVVDKKHLQDFFKRLRHYYKFRYYGVSEYGDKTHRPHYHVIFFGQDFLGGSFKINDELYGNKILEKVWGRGQVAIGRVTMKSIQYVAGYVHKKAVDNGDDDLFCLMSTKPGIGKSWLDKYYGELVRNGFVVIDGVRLDIPKAYLDWYVEAFVEVKEKRKENVRRYTTEQLAAKKSNLKAKLGLERFKL